MKTHVAIVAAAALALGGVSFAIAQETAAPPGNPQPETKTEKVEQGVRNAAAKVGIGSADKASEKMTPHAEQIHDVLAQVAEAAFSKDGVSDVAERLCKADRDRLDQNKDALKGDDTFNGRVAEIQKDWKAKFNQSFDIKDEDKVLNQQFASIDEMQASEAARTASGTVTPEAGTAAPAAAPADEAARNAANTGDKKRDTAIVHIAASHGYPALDVPLVHETMGWRIDIPDSVDSAKLKANILTALTDLDEKKDQWPAEADDAYRAVTHRVLLAIFDKPATADAGGAALPAAPATPDASK
jgi:hypothetical protein